MGGARPVGRLQQSDGKHLRAVQVPYPQLVRLVVRVSHRVPPPVAKQLARPWACNIQKSQDPCVRVHMYFQCGCAHGWSARCARIA